MRVFFAVAFTFVAACAKSGSSGKALESRGARPAQGPSAASPASPIVGSTDGKGWKSIGPFALPAPKNATGKRSGAMSSIVFDPANPDHMLSAGNPTGIFRTTDGGKTWVRARAGLEDGAGIPIGDVSALWTSTKHSNVVVAATIGNGVFRSKDGGEHWARVSDELETTQFAELGSTLFCTGKKGIFASNDEGATFSISLATKAAVTAISASGSHVLAGDHDGWFYEWDKGAFKQRGKVPHWVHAIAIDPHDAKVVYASAFAGGAPYYNYELEASLDGGGSWKPVKFDGTLGPQAIAFSAVTPHRLYVAKDGYTIFTEADGNGDPTWEHAAPVDDIRALVVVPNASASDDRCILATDQGVVIAETCAKKNSELHYLGASVSTNLVSDMAISSDGLTIVASMTDFGSPAVSHDGGTTWGDLAAPTHENSQVAIHPKDPSRCYDFGDGFYVSADGCKTFKKTADHRAYVSSTGNYWAFDPSSKSRFFVVASKPAAILETTDGGSSFTQVTWPFDAPKVIAMSPIDAKHILVGDKDGLSLSTDGGATWTHSTGLPKIGRAAVAFEPSAPKIVLVALQALDAVTAYRSKDGGATFEHVGDIDAHVPGSIPFVACDPGKKGRAVATTLTGAFITEDDGVHWKRLDETTTTHHFTSAAFVGKHLYLASYGQGILERVEE